MENISFETGKSLCKPVLMHPFDYRNLIFKNRCANIYIRRLFVVNRLNFPKQKDIIYTQYGEDRLGVVEAVDDEKKQ